MGMLPKLGVVEQHITPREGRSEAACMGYGGVGWGRLGRINEGCGRVE